MSIVNSIETVRDWLTAEVCPLVKLKLPDDNATDVSYPYKLVNPAAFSLFVPSKDRTPPNIAAPIPSVCVQIVQGDDDLLQSARDIKIRLCFSAWDPGYTTGPTSSSRRATAAAPTSSNTTRRRPPTS
jgi:hypothetical protein